MGWIRESKPVYVMPGMQLIALPFQRYVRGDDGQLYCEFLVLDSTPTPFLQRMKRTRAPGVVHQLDKTL